ncbi:DUF6233 domain-containing protein [Streptomyces sp. Da 82-17]|uniref:DUF6233 domain-containing protein n=1 Tax=Streptomyces sp. Da 82-17 TaxID=3377116 RepID=UPI0038D3AD5A
MHDNHLSRLEALRFAERVQLQQLDRIRRWIADEERRVAERRQGERARPPAPDWLIELGIGKERRPIAVHAGGCHMAGRRSRPISRDEAMRSLANGVEACGHCRPDSALGLLE